MSRVASIHDWRALDCSYSRAFSIAMPERLYENLVVLFERLTAGLLGQIKVAEHLVPDAHRNAEEGPHRRVVGGKTDGCRVAGDVVKPDRFGVVDQHT